MPISKKEEKPKTTITTTQKDPIAPDLEIRRVIMEKDKGKKEREPRELK